MTTTTSYQAAGRGGVAAGAASVAAREVGGHSGGQGGQGLLVGMGREEVGGGVIGASCLEDGGGCYNPSGGAGA
eukprot:1156662-Pelagomonas_calceolata.AAC.7